MSARRLHNDERGAIAVMGIGIATFLIGATWFVFGLARTAVFRQRVQEAADAGAFSSAALHAKGMNLISAINLILFAITAVWVLLRTFEHIMFLLQTTVVWNASNCDGFGCSFKSCAISPLAAVASSGTSCMVAYELKEIRDLNKTARKKVGDVMDKTFPALSKVQDATARIAPMAGTAVSIALGAKFDHFTIAVGPSNIPGDKIVDLLSKSNEPHKEPNGAPLGLPVVANRFGYLCNRTAKIALNTAKDAVGSIPPLGTVLDLPIIKQVVDGVIGGAAGYIEQEFCSNGDWAGSSSSTRIFKEHGPKVMFAPAKNGSDFMQIWAFTKGITEDHHQKKIALAKRQFGGVTGDKTEHWYVAQSEFYFDCSSGWDDGSCNGDDNAMFNMKWRARLVRIHKPNLLGDIWNTTLDALLNGPIHDGIQDFLGLNGPGAGLDPSSLSSGNLFQQQLTNSGFDQVFDLITGKAIEQFNLEANPNAPVPEFLH